MTDRFSKLLFRGRSYIGGLWHSNSEATTFPVANPANGEVLAQVESATPEDALSAVSSAVKALPAWRKGNTGSPILAGVLCTIECKLNAEHEAGDHTIAVGEVLNFSVENPEGRPLLFFRGAYGAYVGIS